MISIVIPLFNKQDSILKTLKSVLNQDFEEYEIIIINDGSTDKSADLLQVIKDRRIKIIHKDNGGVCSARNRGIKEASSEYIALLDADDIWEPEYLAEQLKLISDFPDAAMWGLGFDHLSNDRLEGLDHVLPAGFRGYVKNYFSIKRKSDIFCSSSVVIRKGIFNTIGYFDTRIKYSEDIDMWYRIILNYPVVFYNKTMVYYNHDAENRAMLKQKRLVESLAYYYEKYALYYDNKEFIIPFSRSCAGSLCYYYYESENEKEEAKQVIKQIPVKYLKPKYKLLCWLPYPLGILVYKILKQTRKLR